MVDAKIAMKERAAYQVVDNEAGHEDELAVEKLPLEKRNQMLVLSLIYGTERSCMVCALEAATSMMLEVEFKWNSRDAGWPLALSFWNCAVHAVRGEMKRCQRIQR